jgi:hypothetical protein
VAFYECCGPRGNFDFVLFIGVLNKPYDPLIFVDLLKKFLYVFYCPFLSVVQRSK